MRNLYTNYPLYSLLCNDFSVLDTLQEVYELHSILDVLRQKNPIRSVFESCSGKGEQKNLYRLNFPNDQFKWQTLDLNVSPKQTYAPDDHVQADMFSYDYPLSDCTLLLNNTLASCVFYFEDGCNLFNAFNSPLVISQMPPEIESSFYSPIPSHVSNYTNIEVDIPVEHPVRQQLKLGASVVATLLTSNEFYFDVTTGMTTLTFKNVSIRVGKTIKKMGDYFLDWHNWSIFEMISMAAMADYKLLGCFESRTSGIPLDVTGKVTSIVQGKLIECKPNWLIFAKQPAEKKKRNTNTTN